VENKLKSDGSINKFKELLIAKGFTQSNGIDYQLPIGTYACLTKLSTTQILLSLDTNLILTVPSIKWMRPLSMQIKSANSRNLCLV
jgi:hypothetical protein